VHQKWIILDAMGVIYVEGDDNNVLLVPFVQHRNTALTREEINALYEETSLGHISSAEFWARLGFGSQYPAIETDYLDTCLEIDPDFLPTAEVLRGDYTLAMLSNDVSEWSKHLRERFGLGDLFGAVAISGDLGLRKPDRRIFEVLFDRMQADPSDCVFVDDNLKNLSAASDIGLRTVWFRRTVLALQSEYSPDAQIRSFLELPSVVDDLFRRSRTSH
jgi:putative hydrolase of the HAD superfamily